MNEVFATKSAIKRNICKVMKKKNVKVKMMNIFLFFLIKIKHRLYVEIEY